MNQTVHPKGGVAPVSRKVMNLSHFCTQAARRLPDTVGLVWGKQAWTWSEIEARVSAFAAALADAGVAKGDRVLVHSKNCNQIFESMLAVFRLGAVWVPTNFRLIPDEVVYLCQDSGANVFLCHADFPEHAKAVAEACKDLALLAGIRKASFARSDIDTLMAPHLGKSYPSVAVEYDDPCWFFFTSGTTGRPKAAVLTHGQMAFVVTNHLCDLMPGTTEKDASLVVAPLSHGAGIHQLTQVARGAKTVLLEKDRFDPEEAWQLVQEHRVTNMFTVPTILKMLTEHQSVDTYDHSSLRYVIYAGAPMYREDQKHAVRKLGKVIVQYFGLGEVTGNITSFPGRMHDEDDAVQGRIGTCGYARTGVQISIQDEAGQELPPGESGEICVCGPAVFAGYYNKPEANEKSFRNGWFRTGDLGYMDEQGFLFITGRASDMYISGGSNVYPREIEEKILTHPAVSEVAIVGVPDKTWGEVGVAVCVLKPGASLTESDLLGFMESKVARYKVPKRVFFWSELPKSGYGKITKKLVTQELEARGLLPLTA
jgi:fatty-acyl-CoA synthase